MIGKVRSGKSFGATYRYALRPQADTQAKIIGGNLGPAGTTASEISSEELDKIHHQAQSRFEIQATVSERALDKNTAHWVVGYPPSEVPTDAQMKEHCESYIAGMIVLGEQPELKHQPEQFKRAREEFKRDRISEYQFSIVRHHDKDHPHAHIVLGRTNLRTGKAINQSYIHYRSATVCTELEKEFGLTKLNREPQTKLEQNFHQEVGGIVEPEIRELWKANGYSNQFQLKTESFDIRAYPASGKHPERLTVYPKDEKKPAISLYREPQKEGKTYHCRRLDIDQANEWRDRLIKLRLEREAKLKREKLQQQKLEQEQQNNQQTARKKTHTKNKSEELER